MTHLVLLVTLVVAVTCVVLITTIVCSRVLSGRRTAHRAQVAAPARGHVLELVAGEPEDVAKATASLLALPPAEWAAAEPMVVGFMGRLRGEPHRHLVEVLRRRGVVQREVAALGARSAHRRARAALFVGSAACDEAAPQVVRLLADPSAQVRTVAVRVLGRIGGPAEATALLTALRGPHPVPWSVTADAVARLGSAAATATVTALADDSARVRAAAAYLAGTNSLAGTAEKLAALVTDDPDPAVRRLAARSLGRIASAAVAAVPLRAAALADPAPAVRLAAIEGLAALGGSVAQTALLELCADEDLGVARQAGAQLLRLGDRVRPALSSAADDEACPEALRLSWVRAELRATSRLPAGLSVAGRW